MSKWVTRQGLGPYLKERLGVNCSESWLSKQKGGDAPPIAGTWGRRIMYDTEECLKWAEARLKPARPE